MDKPSPNYAGKMVIPTFTVTINPMEEDEVTYDMVPPSTAHPRYTHWRTFMIEKWSNLIMDSGPSGALQRSLRHQADGLWHTKQ